MRTNKCANCGGQLTSARKRDVQRVAGREFVVTVAASECRSCRSVFLENASLQRAELEIACDLARHGPAAGDSFRYLRKAMGMRAIDLAALLDVTPETISRWENGQRDADKAAWLTLGSLVLERASRNPQTLDRLRDLRSNSSTLQSTVIDASRVPPGRPRAKR